LGGRTRFGGRGFVLSVALVCAIRQHIDLTRDDAAAGDLDLAVADIAADAAGGMNCQLVIDDQIALEMAADFGGVDLGLALEHAGGGDLDSAAVGQRRFDEALDH